MYLQSELRWPLAGWTPHFQAAGVLLIRPLQLKILHPDGVDLTVPRKVKI
jgi:hypothetical protein